MSTFEVAMELVVHCKVKVIVAADNAADAIEQAAASMPNNFDAASRAGWKAKLDVKPPKGTMLVSGRVNAIHFETASGGEKAKKVG